MENTNIKSSIEDLTPSSSVPTKPSNTKLILDVLKSNSLDVIATSDTLFIYLSRSLNDKNRQDPKVGVVSDGKENLLSPSLESSLAVFAEFHPHKICAGMMATIIKYCLGVMDSHFSFVFIY